MNGRRWFLLVAAPIAFAITGTLHLVAAGGGTGSSEFEQIMRHAGLWITIHVVQIAFICLLGGAVLVLARGLQSRAAAVARVAVVPFVAFYSAFDAVAGLSNGLLARYAQEHPAQASVVSDASAALSALKQPAIVVVYVIAVACWLLASVGVAFALRGIASTAAIVLLGTGAAIFAIDHAAPFGPIGMVLFLAGSILVERTRKVRNAGESTQLFEGMVRA